MSKMTLYEIDKRIEDAMERAVDPETGEIISDEAMAELEQLDMDRGEKIENTAMYYKNLMSDADQLKAEAKKLTDSKERANAYHSKVVPVMEKLRTPADKLEMIVDKKYWPMPSYGDLMFEV